MTQLLRTDLTIAVKVMGWPLTKTPDDCTPTGQKQSYVHRGNTVLYSEPYAFPEDVIISDDCKFGHMWHRWTPTQSIAQAWQVIEQVMAQPAGGSIELSREGARAIIAEALCQAHLYTLRADQAAEQICGLIVDAFCLDIYELLPEGGAQ